ncbi:hypothetical protein AAVH_09620 [Aphelenchoides avenae]|nr:hypothetical protein AAVH_09620 [Aphelenchus avenae]
MQLSRLDAFLSEELYLNPIRLRIGFATVNYCLCFQMLAHLYIAVNRYSVIARPLDHNSIWTGTRLRWMVLSLFLLPVPCAALYVSQPTYAITMYNADGTRIHVPRSPLATLAMVTTSTSAAYNVFTALLSIILELQTLIIYKGMNEALKKSRKEDYRLLLYAMCQFVGQFLMTLYFIIVLTSNVAWIPGLLSAARLSYSYVIDVLCFTGPICLFFTSKTLRLHYVKMFARDWQRVTKVSFFKQSTESR